MTRTRQPDATLSSRRLEAFTDGVFAIAATLLVLDLTVNDLPRARTNGDLWAHLLDMAPAIISFTLSFFLLCLLWTIHVRQFEFIVRIDGAVLVLNSVRLFGVVLVPFTTSIYNSFTDLALGRVLLPLNFFWVLVFSYVLWLHVTRRGSTLIGGMTPAEVRRSQRDALSSVILGAVVVALAPFIGSLAFLAFILDPVLSRLVGGGSIADDRAVPGEAGSAAGAESEPEAQ